jgi:hypothetical protein
MRSNAMQPGGPGPAKALTPAVYKDIEFVPTQADSLKSNDSSRAFRKPLVDSVSVRLEDSFRSVSGLPTQDSVSVLLDVARHVQGGCGEEAFDGSRDSGADVASMLSPKVPDTGGADDTSSLWHQSNDVTGENSI